MINVIEYIKNNSENEISSREIEKISGYTYRHFQRIFKKIFSETIQNFITRTRLEIAYKKLIYTNDSISDIALILNYKSLQSFSKAFSTKFLISPSKARKNKEDFFLSFISSIENSIEINKVFIEKQYVYYKFIKTNNYNNDEINKVWRELDIKNTSIKSYNSYGIIADQPLITEHKNCIYGFAIDKIYSTHHNLIKKEIFGRNYLKFTHYGSYDTIEETYKQFYKYWINHQKIELGESEVIEHYVVSAKESSQEKDYITNIYFPLK